mgnify:CR=1 FL=1
MTFYAGDPSKDPRSKAVSASKPKPSRQPSGAVVNQNSESSTSDESVDATARRYVDDVFADRAILTNEVERIIRAERRRAVRKVRDELSGTLVAQLHGDQIVAAIQARPPRHAGRRRRGV